MIRRARPSPAACALAVAAALAAVAALLPHPALPTRAEDSAARAARIAPGPVTVTVRSAGDGRPVADAFVRLGGRLAATSPDGIAVFDGVPAGDTLLSVADRRFDALDRQLRLAPGKREPVELALVPVTPAALKGKVTLEGHGGALAGARVSLTPVRVAAAQKGPCRFMTAWDGTFRVPQLPPGTWRADVSAAGCVPRAFELEVKPGMADVAWELPREIREASLTVAARDAATGRPIAGARVVVAEAGARGFLAEGTTGDDGAAVFRGLRTGRLNWEDAKGHLAAARRAVTVTVSRDGYETAVASTALDASAAAAVSLNPLAKIAETEPNGDHAAATPIRTGAPVELRIDRVGDRDFFRFRLHSPGLVRVVIEAGTPVETYLFLHSAGGALLAQRGAVKGAENVIDAGGLPAGEYVVQAEEWNCNDSSPDPFTLKVLVTPAPDALEPDDSAAAARVLRSGEEVRACLLPRGDVDWFRFEVKRPSHVRVTMPAHPLERYVFVRDASGNVIGQAGSASGQPLELTVAASPGAFLLDLHEWNDNAESAEPCMLRLEQIEDDGEDEPPQDPGRPAAKRVLPPGDRAGGTIFPAGDVDWYSIPIPGAGRFHAEFISVTEVYALIRSSSGAVLAQGGAGRDQGLHLACDLGGPATLFLDVHEWNDNDCSPSPYVVSTWFEPCDELELMGRNDSAAAATPVEAGEPIRGSILPTGDVDWFRLEVDHPGFLRLEGVAPAETYILARDAEQRVLMQAGFSSGAPIAMECEVRTGTHFVEVHEWNDNGSATAPYRLTPVLRRAEPQETLPLAGDPVRSLRPGEAQAFRIDQLGDRDRFSFAMTEAGTFTIRVRNPVETYLWLFDDQTGALLHQQGLSAGADGRMEFGAKGPTRYRLELGEWNDNGVSGGPGFVLVDREGRDIPAETCAGAADAFEPVRVTFARAAVAGMAGGKRARVDADGDGRWDFDLGSAPSAWTYGSEGAYRAVMEVTGENGVATRVPFWVDATGPRERKGVHVVVDWPGEGQAVEEDLPARARAISFTGAPIASVAVALDGKALARLHSSPWVFEIPWSKMGAGEHVLAFTATDLRGESATLERRVRRGEYFDLRPRDGAVVTGNAVRVAWAGPSFGPARVRYRPKGAPEWSEAVGESGRMRVVPLDGLEPGKPYEFQPVGGAEPGPVRTVTRVKGLAFGKPAYAAKIRRDYDQRAGVSVRNHGDRPQTVRLECGRPPEESRLLAGFVGDGSEGAPFVLDPGEEREFLLGLSAQDCVVPRAAFAVRLVSTDGGTSDEALVTAEIQLPRVDLVWEERGTAPDGLSRVLALRNNGDPVTDLAVASASPDLFVSPSVGHGFLPAGGVLELRVAPRLHEGFRKAAGRIVARAVNKSVETTQSFALKDGEQVYGVDLGPAGDDPESAAALAGTSLAAAFMNPASVDWSRRAHPQDTDGDGRPDRWTVDIPAESTRWTGSDSNGDGEVDIAQADVGPDGRVDFCALLGPRGWEETNLVDAHLEMGFKLPWDRSAYEKHDVDIVMNGVVVGRLRDRIPEGNYTFRLPPSAFRFDASGSPERNEIQIQSKHLRGGHYVVSSDFRLKANLTATRAWAVGTSREEAAKSVRKTPGLVLDASDLSVSSEDVQVLGEARGGAPIRVSLPLRNLGAGTARRVAVALRFNAGGEDIELARAVLADVAPGASPLVTLEATAPAGEVVLKVVADPEKRVADSDRDNNEARVPFRAAGDAVKPAMGDVTPGDGARLAVPVVDLLAKATDDAGVARVDVRVDQGLWSRLSRTPDGFAGRALLQPGAHRLTFRALDTSGNAAEKAVTVTVEAAAPEVGILEPAEGARLDARRARVVVSCGATARRAAVRVNGGPWQPAEIRDGTASAEVDLPFGEVALEAASVDARGVRGTASRRFSCTRQPDGEEEPAGGPPPEGGAPLDVPGLGPVDPFGDANPVATDPEAQGGPEGEPVPEPGEADAAGPIADPDRSAEKAEVPDEPGADGLYGGAPPEGMEPGAQEGLEEEEGPDADDEEIAAEDWLQDPDVETAEDPELADPPDTGDADYEPPDMEAWDEMPVDGEDAAGPDGGSGPSWPPPGEFPPPGGGYVGVQQRQSDWYCTNRPEIGVGFQMPDWLKKLNLPKPGTAEFEKALQDRLAALRARGVDTSKLEAFRRILLNRCGRLDSPEQLPTFLQSLGLAKPDTQDPAALQAWRERMASSADAFMLRLLHSNDPALIAAGLRARADALGQFDTATKEAAEAAIETIKANQKITEDFATMVPYLNVAVSARALWSGESLSGEKLGKLDMVLHALSITGPVLKLLQNPALRQTAASLGSKAMWVGEKTIGRLAAKMGVTPERLRAALNAFSEVAGNARIKAGEKLFGKMWAAEQRFLNSPAGREAAARAAKDLRQAESLLHRIAQARAAGDKAAYRKLIGALQGNKTAQGLLNSGKYSNQFRAALDKTHRAMGRLADKRTITELMRNDKVRKQIEALAKKFGVPPGDIVIRARNVSGNVKTLRSVKPGEMLKYGADRDVVYQFVTRRGKTLSDVHHKLVEKVYARNLRSITGRSLYEMDHVVTSRWHPEAYNPGRFRTEAARNGAIGDIISGKAAGRLNRPTDVRDTIIHKGREWMEAGHKIAERGNPALGNQKVKEGMRQMIKEYERQVAQFLQAKGLNPAKALPPRLRQGLEVFRKVQKGATVEQARAMLKALTPKGGLPVTPETIADDLGSFVEYMNRWGLKTP